MPEEGLDPGFPPTESNKKLHRIIAPTCFKDMPEEGAAALSIEDTVLFKEREGVGREYFGPLVAVVAR